MPQTDVPGEKTVADAALPDQAAGLLAHLRRRERPHRLHAGAARAGAREPEAVPLGAVAVRAAAVGPNDPRLGSINIGNTAGGVNWPGSGFDPETGIFYTQASNSERATPSASTIEERVRRGSQPRGTSAADRRACRGAEARAELRCGGAGHGAAAAARRAGRAARPRRGAVRRPRAAARGGSGRAACRPLARAVRGGAGAKGLDGLPIVKPPYGVIAAIDLNNGDAEVAGAARRHAGQRPRTRSLQRHEHPKTGQSGSVGVLVTKTLRGRRRLRRSPTPPGAPAARCSAPTTRRPARRSARC